MVKELESFSSNDYEYEDWNDHLECPNSTISQIGTAIAIQQNPQEEKSPTFGNISVTNGTDIHFGNKTFYQGPVTIQQYVYGDKTLKKVDEREVPPCVIKKLNKSDIGRDFKTGIDNPTCVEEPVIQNGNTTTVNCIPADEYGRFRGHHFKKLLFEHRLAMASALVFVLVVSMFGLVSIVFLKPNDIPRENDNSDFPSANDEDDHNTPIKAPTDPVNSLKPLKLKIVTRLEWLAQPPTQELDNLTTPVPYVIISHTATENCSSQAQCVFQVRYIQTFHMESRGWWDIGYNFLVGGDGEVYYGRGWDKMGSHTYGYNLKSIGISFIGTFISAKPPEYQLIACKKLIEKGVELGYIRKDYKLLGARQLQTTQSPGEALYKEIQTWEHWSQNP